ncbi:phosphoesterase RecJ domain protein [Pyrolobus fumarii 1A]|uniref:Phosphoesterase RecJ domain protein n=1 Tax=Pyrolobus fumarii (strain DSM 11204 / 1A) TaxID=694429 RepID=G0EE05_PYRF1|nr:DHH family phosphoesterase [Pyrolobus fumarii]AEM37921.1 phosphoesterase RecJ domain protein [Pyrolobus fumarii 1A]
MRSVYVLSEEELREKARRALREILETETPVVVTAHKNADPDAVGSAYAIREALRSLGVDARLLLPEGMNQASKRVVRELLGIEPADFEDESPEESGLAIVLDTASFEHLGDLAEFVKNVDYIVIDHHEKSLMTEGALVSICDPGAKATAELVYLVLREWSVKIDERMAALLLAGIVYDTKHLRHSAPRTLRVAADLMELGASLERVLKALQSPPMDYSERVARLKAAQRLQVYKTSNNLLIGVSHVKAFEASAARAILDLGADAAFIVSVRDGRARVVGRALKSFVEGTGLALGEIMEEVGKMLGGSGGGHSQAAGAAGKATLEKALTTLVEVLKRKLEEKGLELSPLD